MGVGVGIGPFSAGVRISNRELGGIFGFALLVAAAFAIVIGVLTLLPLAGLVIGILLMVRRRYVAATAAIAASVAGAAWLWPAEYSAIRYSASVPDVTSAQYDVPRAKRELADAGFHDVRVKRTGTPGPDSFCWVEKQNPAPPSSADTRKAVTIVYTCSPPAD